MRPRKDGFGWLLSPVLVLSGIACAQLPGQRSTDTMPLRAASTPSVRGNFPPSVEAQPAANGKGTTRDIVPTSAPGPALPVPAPTGDSLAKLHTIYREAQERYAGVDSYIVRLVRREQLNGKDKPEEVLLFKFRKEPWSVYFKWLGTEGKGREVVFVPGRYESKIHTLLAAGDIPLMPGGKRFAVNPESPFVLSSSRHPIQRAGVGALIEGFGKQLAEMERHGPGRAALKYLGLMQRPEFSHPCEAVEQTLLAGADPQLPRGGQRLWCFDPELKFPVLIVTQDETGHEVEYYCYDRFEFPVHLDDDDFNPDKLWSPKREPAPSK